MIFERLVTLLDVAENYVDNSKEINDECRKYLLLIKLKKSINEFWGVDDYINAGFKMDDLVEFGIVYKISENLYQDQWQFKYDKNGFFDKNTTLNLNHI